MSGSTIQTWLAAQERKRKWRERMENIGLAVVLSLGITLSIVAPTVWAALQEVAQ